jgi:hypothetical protein
MAGHPEMLTNVVTPFKTVFTDRPRVFRIKEYIFKYYEFLV